MITKEEFTRFIEAYQIFEKGLDRLSEALTGSKYGIPLFETDWGDAVGEMLDVFLDSHFTVEGADWVTYYLFEDVDDKLVTVKQEKDIFNEEKEIEYHLNSLEKLWNFLLTDKKLYFKNV